MTHKPAPLLSRRAALAGGAASLLAACADPQRIATATQEEPRGGIGGTGIVGVLTDFGSLIVNGRRILTDGATEVLTPLGQAAVADIAIGQALSIEAATVNGALIARRILIADPLIGRVEALRPGGLSVLGVDVAFDQSLRLTVGERVAVSGLWRGDQVVASRIAPALPGPDAILGAVGATGRIGPVPLIPAPGVPAPEAGVFAIARGTGRADGFAAEAIAAGRFTGAAGPLTDLSVEGYLDPADKAPFFTLSGLGHSFDAAAELSAFAETRAVYEGPYTGDFAVETGLILPEDAFDRRRLLADLSAGRVTPSRRRARQP